MNHTRRRFFEDSIMAAAAVALPSRLIAAEPSAASTSPNEKLIAAIIGCGIRGKAHARELARLADCDVAYICDPDLDRADEVGALLTELKRPMPKKVQDLRVVLDDKSVDVVFIAAPNHWHALAAHAALLDRGGRGLECPPTDARRASSHRSGQGKVPRQSCRRRPAQP